MSQEAPSGELIRPGQNDAFVRWQMPSFDEGATNVIQTGDKQDEPEEELPVEEPVQEAEPEPDVEVEDVQLEEVQPLTLEEVEAVRQDAYNEGFSTGEKDGFRAGQLRAQQEAEAALKPRLAALENLMQQLFDPIGQQDQAIEHMLLELVRHISEEVIQRELTLSSAQIGRVLREAMKLLPMDDGQVRIHVNPQDFAEIKSLRERHEESWRILEDDSLLPGGCRIETRNSQIDASVETRLHTLTQQLLEQRRHLQSEPVAADIHQDIDLTAAPLPEPAAVTETPPVVEPVPEPVVTPAAGSTADLVDMQLMGDDDDEA
ncbi:MAG: flagellar assembly protein FliH [Thiopseudomonas sp.]|nr:flagellar assembly protein FliH [Gammaproteobacteria bacterium]